ncbi:MAG: hypothetical protein A2284_07120 [Deltaproteobacteria bacterium RIFOXYA12_FULL_61_11]|nr:MAG: hypothetical protein A2284_07120 [Deltaproteobacteria bacterium RIFOXYA12_FULL_61_11]
MHSDNVTISLRQLLKQLGNDRAKADFSELLIDLDDTEKHNLEAFLTLVYHLGEQDRSASGKEDRDLNVKRLLRQIDNVEVKAGFSEILATLDRGQLDSLDGIILRVYRSARHGTVFGAEDRTEQPARGERTSLKETQRPEEEVTIRQPIREVIEAIRTGRYAVPLFPQAAQKVLKMLEDRNLTVTKIAEDLKFEIEIASKLISISNSAIYGGITKTKSLETAIVRIGLLEVRKHLYLFTTRDIYQPKATPFDNLMAKLRDHAVATANAAYLVARKLDLKADRILLLALFHDIGKLCLINIFNEIMGEGDLVAGEQLERSLYPLFAQLHQKLGERLLKNWGFDYKFSLVAANHHARVYPGDLELCCVQFGNALAKIIGHAVSIEADTAQQLEELRGILKLSSTEFEMIKIEVDEFMQQYN